MKFSGKLRRALIFTAILLLGINIIFSYKYKFIYNTGDSMQPTYENRELIIMEKLRGLRENWEPDRFDVVIINDNEGSRLVKRVIGLPGDTIEIKEGLIYLNEKKLKDPLGDKGRISFYLSRYESSKKITVPVRSVWLIGDNRPDSWFGTLPIKNIEGLVAL